MRRKSLWIPILVFIFSFITLSFYQKCQSTGILASTTELPPILWSKNSADILKVVYCIKNKQIIVEREEKAWYLSNHEQADSLSVYTMINPFLEPKIKEVIEVSPQDLSIYGIDDTSCKLSLYDLSDNEYTIVQGAPTKDELSYVYVPLTDTVYTMPTSLFDNLSINKEDWLNKQLLTFDLEEVAAIDFSYKGLETTLLPTTSETGTIFTDHNINPSLCEKFVGFLKNSKIEKFITRDAAEHILEVYGFHNPSLQCTISLKSGETLSLTIGSIKQDENICYAMVNHNRAIVAIPYFDFSQFDTLFADLEASNTLLLG